MAKLLITWFERIEKIMFVQAIRSGLVMAIPILLIGSFALILRFLPIAAYQTFIEQALGGALAEIFTFANNATFGMLSIYMTLTISVSYSRLHGDKLDYIYGPPLTCTACFALFSGMLSDHFVLSSFGVKGMFLAIVTALAFTRLYIHIGSQRRKRRRIYTSGADSGFNDALGMLWPATLVMAVAALLNYVMTSIFHVESLQQLFIDTAHQIFLNQGGGLSSGLLFVFLTSLLWFFGVHGSDVLDGVKDSIFLPAMEANMAAVAAGEPATEICTSTFFDVFVLMGGCGTAMCLLAAILLFSRQRSNISLGRLAALPMLFNINELMVFGLPIVFNPIMFIPFIATPLLCALTSYAAMAMGVVPLVTHTVNWTTPMILGGYLATGSIYGALLQVFNLMLGMVVYWPFIRLYDLEKERNARRRLDELVEELRESEISRQPLTLLGSSTPSGQLAKMLALDLEQALERQELALHYQPQFDRLGRCIGAEALLRWNHPLLGMVYPPLVIKIAEEAGYLYALERYIISKVISDLQTLRDSAAPDFVLSVNISVPSMMQPDFAGFMAGFIDKGQVKKGELMLEVTEQIAMQFDEATRRRFEELSELGYPMAIDDFSMGSTSLKYLQENHFSQVKLDGSLVRELKTNPRCGDIISSIVYLSQALGFQVLAEFVETDEQRQALAAIDVYQYQGWLFSKALPLDDVMDILKRQ